MTEQNTFEPKRPDYRLGFRSRIDKNIKGNIGAAWIGKNGNIHIHLEPLVTIKWKDNYEITLFPNK